MREQFFKGGNYFKYFHQRGTIILFKCRGGGGWGVGVFIQINMAGLEQSMKPMIGKSIDQSMTIDALLVNWHRLASANR